MKETTGMRLIRQLNLDSLLYIRAQTIILGYYTVLAIYFNSRAVERPITLKHIEDNNVIRLFRHGLKNREMIISPLRDLRNFNRPLRNKIVIAVDLCGSNFQDRSIPRGVQGVDESIDISMLNNLDNREQESISSDQYSSKSLKDSAYSTPPPLFLQAKGIAKIKHLLEFLTLPALTKNVGMSDFTKKFKKERNKIMGRENSIAKLVKCSVFRKKGYIEFFWKVPATDKYGDDYQFKQALPADFSLHNNPRKIYTVGLRILDFFKWLETYPKGYEITRKDLKDILTISNIQVYSTDPSWHWQGGNYYMSQLDASMSPTDIAPQHWNKSEYHGDGNFLVSKHMQGIFNSLGFYLSNLTSMLNSELKKKGYLEKKQGKGVL